MDSIKLVWDLLNELSHFQTISACLENFINKESINATCIDEMVNDVWFADAFEGFVDDLEGLPELKRLIAIDNVENYDEHHISRSDGD